jgi:hypothetical protein
MKASKKIYRSIVLLALLLYWMNESYASIDTSLFHVILKRIEQKQIEKDRFYIRGLFPAYADKAYKGFSTKMKDNSIFCTAISIYTLRKIRPYVDPSSTAIIDSIVARATPAFKPFVNKNGKYTYNFWRQDSACKFPYNWWKPVINPSWQLPDDFDDTVMCSMALNVHDSIAGKLHQYMQQFSGYTAKKIKGVSKVYKTISAYGTWAGKVFPVFYDVCVAANILTFVQQYHLPWTKADTATLQFILKVIERKDYLNRNYIDVSPYYKNKAVIIYHLARLLAQRPIPQLNNYIKQLAEDALYLFSKSNNILEQVILSTALIRMGYHPPAIDISPAVFPFIEHNDMPFFTADMLGYFEGIGKKMLTLTVGKSIWFNEYCPAYNDVLLLEYLALNSN